MDTTNGLDSFMQDPKGAIKSFWDKPEGAAGKVAMVGLLVLFGLGIYKALPYIVLGLQSALTATLLGVGLFGILYVILNKQFQTAVWYLFQIAMKKFTGFIIELDPINILKSYLESLKRSLGDMERSISKLNGQIRSLDQIIHKNEEDRKESLSIAGKARETGKKQALVLNARRAGRLQKSNFTLQVLRDKLSKLLTVLEKMYEVSEFLYQDTADEVKVQSQQYEATKTAWSAFKSALSVIKGDPDKRAMFDQTMEYMADDFAMKIGEIEEFMKMSSGVIEGVDLQNMVYEEDALNELDMWSQKADSLLLSPGEKQELMRPSSMYDPEVLKARKNNSTDSVLEAASKQPATPAVSRHEKKSLEDFDSFFDSSK